MAQTLSARIEALYDIQAHDMLPTPAEQQKLLLKLLESMPLAEHEMFLGEKLHLLVQAPYLSTIYLSKKSIYPSIYRSIDPSIDYLLSIYLIHLSIYAPIHYHL